METQEKLTVLQNVRTVCISQTTHIAQLALWACNVLVDKPGVAGTYGQYIYFYNDFFERSFGQQIFIYMHELMHMAFRHAVRSAAACVNDLDHEVYNIAADVIINESLKEIKWLNEPPEDGVYLSTIQKEFPDTWNQLPSNKQEITTEDLFFLLIAELKKKKNCAGAGAGEGDGGGDSDGEGNASGQSKVGALGRDLMTKTGAAQDLNNATQVIGTPETISDELVTAKLDSMVRSIQAGTELGNAINKFRRELPPCRTPWQKVLNSFLQKTMVNSPLPNWARPSRYNLAYPNSPYRLPGQHKVQEYEPLVVAVDLSGSCWIEQTQNEFFANIARIQALYKCPVTVVTFDTKIQNVYEIEGGAQGFRKVLNNLKFTGGGGTIIDDLFKPVWVDSSGTKWKAAPKAMVILTDMYFSFPPKPKFPVLWGVLKEGDQSKPPYGRMMILD